MMESMHLHRDTKLSDVFAAYPWLNERLPRVYVKFKLLSSPLGHRLLQTATIADVSERSGIREDILIEKMRGLIAAGA